MQLNMYIFSFPLNLLHHPFKANISYEISSFVAGVGEIEQFLNKINRNKTSIGHYREKGRLCITQYMQKDLFL